MLTNLRRGALVYFLQVPGAFVTLTLVYIDKGDSCPALFTKVMLPTTQADACVNSASALTQRGHRR